MMTGVAATVAASELRVEIVGERRRAYDAAFRARVVAESFLPGARAAELAQRHGICKSLIYRWRRVAAELAAAQRDIVQLRHRLDRAEAIIAVQKKLADLLGIPLEPTEPDSAP